MSVRHFVLGGKALAAGSFAAALIAPCVAYADKNDDDSHKSSKRDSNRPLFDPEALERGAQALREINKSPYAKQALELSRQQELTKQQESKEREAEARRNAAALEKDREHIRYEEERRLEEQRAQVSARMKQYEDELARKRLMAEHELQRQRNAEMVKLQEEASARQEAERLRIEQQIQAERRSAEQYAADLQKQIQREKALAEAEGRIKENRENEDVNRRAALLKYQEETRKAIESINAVMSHLGNAALELITDRNKMLATVGGVTAVFLGIYAARESTRVAGRTIDRWLGTPKLVRETSRFNIWDPKTWTSQHRAKTYNDVKRDFSDIVLPEELHSNVRLLASAASNTKLHGAPFRHMLFYGPPGTGKTMAAKRLARTSGLDYAIMSGGDVAPLGGKAVTQLHQTFDWAERSRRGLLLFIDEADAFLGRRSDEMSEGLRGALNALLYRTGDQSRDFMVVLATNRPGDLDDAVLDRMDEALEFGLPSEAERKKILQLYMDKYIAKAGTAEGEAGAGATSGLLDRFNALLRGRRLSADRIQIEGIDDKIVSEVARATEGFSGRELAKFMAAVQATVYGLPEAKLTPEVLLSVLKRKLYEHQERKAFRLGHHGTGDSPAQQQQLPPPTNNSKLDAQR